MINIWDKQTVQSHGQIVDFHNLNISSTPRTQSAVLDSSRQMHNLINSPEVKVGKKTSH